MTSVFVVAEPFYDTAARIEVMAVTNKEKLSIGQSLS